MLEPVFNLFDNLFPKVALRREIAKYQLDALKKRYYDAAKRDNFRRTPTSSINPNNNIQQGALNVRALVRDLDDNHDLVVGVLDTLVNNIVGAGIQVTPQTKTNSGELNTEYNEQIQRLFDDWCKSPECTREYDFKELQRLLCRAWLRDGEVIINQLRGKVRALEQTNRVHYTLQALECDYLAFDYTTTGGSNRVVQGVELDSYNRPLAYYLYESNDFDVFSGQTVYVQPTDMQRMPASQIIHCKFSRRLNQVRGISALHAVLTRLDDLKEYTDSERIAARVAAAFTGYIKKSPDLALPGKTDDELQDRTIEMEPGIIFDNLLPGEEIGTFGSNRPNPELANFTNAMLRAVAAGTGTAYSTISRNYDGSYSSQRQSMVETQVNYQRLQNYFVSKVIEPIYREFIQMALLSGVIDPLPAGNDTLYDAYYVTPQMPWIDPEKEAKANQIALANGFRSRTDIIRSAGKNPELIAKQIQAEKTLFEAVTDEPENSTEPETEPDASVDQDAGT